MKRINGVKADPRLQLQNPPLTIEYIPVSKFIPDPLNARKHSDKQIAQIAQSIASFGCNVPLLIDQHLRIIAGHGRFEACKLLGLEEAPAIRLEHLTNLQRRAYMIADNRVGENSEWDEVRLGHELKLLSEADLDFSLEATGFEMAQIDLLIEEVSNVVEEDPADTAPALEQGAISSIGDVWQLGRHRILCGDPLSAANYRQLLQGKKADIVFTDPPFNVPIDGYATGFGKVHHREFAMAAGEMSGAEFGKFLTDILKLLAKNSRNGSIHFICMGWHSARLLLEAGAETYTELKNICVWNKESGGQGSLYRSQHELVFVFKAGSAPHRNNIQLGKHGRYRTNIWQYQRTRPAQGRGTETKVENFHPTMKPVALVADAILDCSARGDSVLDCFLGSGTTLIAAERTGRVCYGVELDPIYVDACIRRWQAFTGRSAVHAASGETFDSMQEVNHA